GATTPGRGLGAERGSNRASLSGTRIAARPSFCEPPLALQKIPKSNCKSGSLPASTFALSTYSLALGDIAAHWLSVGSLGLLPPRPPPPPPRPWTVVVSGRAVGVCA